MLQIFDQLDEKSTELLLNTLGVFSLLVWVKVFNMMRIIGVLRAGGDNRQRRRRPRRQPCAARPQVYRVAPCCLFEWTEFDYTYDPECWERR